MMHTCIHTLFTSLELSDMSDIYINRGMSDDNRKEVHHEPVPC